MRAPARSSNLAHGQLWPLLISLMPDRALKSS
jgi:hypothetical protein